MIVLFCCRCGSGRSGRQNARREGGQVLLRQRDSRRIQQPEKRSEVVARPRDASPLKFNCDSRSLAPLGESPLRLATRKLAIATSIPWHSQQSCNSQTSTFQFASFALRRPSLLLEWLRLHCLELLSSSRSRSLSLSRSQYVAPSPRHHYPA